MAGRHLAIAVFLLAAALVAAGCAGSTAHRHTEASAPLTPAKAEAVFTGSVVDEAGHPVANAAVSFQHIYAHSARTDASGRFTTSFIPGSNGLDHPVFTAKSPDGDLASIGTFDPAEGSLTITVRGALALRGKVVGLDGTPIKGAAVSASLPDAVFKGGVTDSKGRYEIRGIPPASDFDIQAQAAGYSTMMGRTTTVSGDKGPVVDVPDIRLVSTEGFIAGRVVYADGTPVKGAEVVITGVGRRERIVKTEDNGRFMIDKVGKAANVMAYARTANGATSDKVKYVPGERYMRLTIPSPK